ncbi:glycerol-3-phosphate responsive antiterminator [Rossellomorea sp. LjRoot5]|uniref:glycerol-3-phosphate responsive antiterminator n=1 Tax=Rossellomorea sp. LjRoot5 TaxID=3342331 RepID=UPI003ED10872
MKPNIIDIVQSQVIASIKEEKDLEKAIQSNANIVFILTGNLITMNGYLKKLKEAGKTTFIHIWGSLLLFLPSFILFL